MKMNGASMDIASGRRNFFAASVAAGLVLRRRRVDRDLDALARKTNMLVLPV